MYPYKTSQKDILDQNADASMPATTTKINILSQNIKIDWKWFNGGDTYFKYKINQKMQ